MYSIIGVDDMVKSVEINAHAKINLALDVISRREDGYHELRMIMQQIELHDVLYIEEIEAGNISISCSNPNIPVDASNLVYKSWKLMSNLYKGDNGIRIHIDKHIPAAAGLAGGSADAAAVLKGLNVLWNMGLTNQELMDIAVNIGADVPYCIMGKTALAEGIGEKLTAIQKMKETHILLARPPIDVSTAQIYKSLDLDNIKTHPDIERLIKYIRNNYQRELASNMVNVLETVTVKKYPIIEKIKLEMMRFGALGSMMSGSGPSVFGIFDDYENMSRCKNDLERWAGKVIMTKTI